MPRIEKVLIVNPNTRWFDRRFFHLTAYTPSLLAAIVKEDVDVALLDPNLLDLDYAQVADRIRAYAPHMVAITCLSLEYATGAKKLAKIAKDVSDDIVVVLGGIYGTLMPETAMKTAQFDFVIMGEAEMRFPKLIRRMNKGQTLEFDFDGISYRKGDETIVQPVTEYIDDVDQVPFPDYSKVDTNLYFNTVNKASVVNQPKQFPFADTITSRGCPFHCIYCSSQAINGPSIRYRSAENVLKEVDWLVNTYGIRHITFNDDNFFLDKRRVKKIMRGLIERNYDLSWKTVNAAVYAMDDEVVELVKLSGGYQLFLAVESGSQYVLKHIINKPLKLEKVDRIVAKCKEVGLQTMGIFMIGLPGETWEQIRETFKYAEQLDCDASYFNIATPLPCTAMYDIAKEKGYLEEGTDLDNIEFFGFGKATMTTEEFNPFELQVLRAFEWDRINFSTERKKEVMRDMLGLNRDELETLRRDTRRSLGVGKTFSDEVITGRKA